MGTYSLSCVSCGAPLLAAYMACEVCQEYPPAPDYDYSDYDPEDSLYGDPIARVVDDYSADPQAEHMRQIRSAEKEERRRLKALEEEAAKKEAHRREVEAERIRVRTVITTYAKNLARQKRKLSKYDPYDNLVDDSRWLAEREYFLERVIERDIGQIELLSKEQIFTMMEEVIKSLDQAQL